MKAFSCGDVVRDCDARWLGATDEEILFQVATHAMVVHRLEDIPSELVEQVRAAIRAA